MSGGIKEMAMWGMIALMAACGGETLEQRGQDAMNGQTTVTDFGSLVRPSSPNSYLVSPAPPASGYYHITVAADEMAPEFDVSAAKLTETWVDVIGKEPRVTVVTVSEDGQQVEAKQASAVFGFVDDVSFRAIPIADDRSTFVAYSRSRVGYWDLGANKSRLSRWLEALEAAITKKS